MTGFTFGENDSHVSIQNNRWKAEKHKRYRVSFINWPGLAEGKPNFKAKGPEFQSAKIHYFEKVGYVLSGGLEFEKAFGKAKDRIATLIAVWPCSEDGKLDKARFDAEGPKIYYWFLSKDKYLTLANQHSEFPFGEWDVNVYCEDAAYQKMTFMPAQGGNLAQKVMEKDTPMWKNILFEAQELLKGLEVELGREMTIEQVNAALAGNPVTPTKGGASANRALADNIDKSFDVEDFLGK